MSSRSPLRLLVGLALTAGLFAAAVPCRADEPTLEAIRAEGGSLRYRVATTKPEANDIETGGAAIIVKAPIHVARQVVTDYRHYAKFIPTFEQARVLSRKDGKTDVYLDVLIAHGAMHVWSVVKFGAPQKVGDEEQVVGEFVKGNVGTMRAVWRLSPIDEQTTVVKLELFVDPNLPFPASLITPELAYASDTGVTAVRARAESIVSADVAKN